MIRTTSPVALQIFPVPSAQMQFGILGPLTVTSGDESIDLPSAEQRTLLAILLANANHVVSADRIADWLWGDAPPREPNKALHHHVSKLRERLGSPAAIATAPPGYVLRVASPDLDTLRFDTLAESARNLAADDPKRAAALLDEALALWRGPILSEFQDSHFARKATTHYNEKRTMVREDRYSLAIDTGHSAEVLEELEARAAEDPLRERIAHLLMLALHRTGRQAEALQAFHRLRTHLVEELGIDPSGSTRKLAERILDRDPTLLDPASPRQLAPVGKRVKDFEITERIGEGGFGIVYVARQISVGRDVALKSIRPEFANEAEFLRRFESEAQLVARLEHPHIVPLYDFWRDADGAYLAMRLLRGGSLKESLDVGPWRPERLARLIEQIASAAHAAHRQGIIHRDIKPANVLLDQDGHGYLSDFGIAKFIDARQAITRTGGAPITPAYVAPELLQTGGEVSPAADVYSLAIVAHEALSGAHPYSRDSVSAMIQHQLHDPLPPVPDAPAASAVLARATAKDPVGRYRDIRTFATDLVEALTGAGWADALSGAVGPTPQEREAVISDFINDEAPFGPIAMDEIMTPAIYRQLYDSDNRIYEEITQRSPSFIVGRRGAGKTALMRAPLLESGNLLVEFKSADLFAQVLRCVESLESHGGRIFANQIADLWDGVIWTGLCLATLRAVDSSSAPQEDLRTVQRFVAAHGDVAVMTVDGIAARRCRDVAAITVVDPNPNSALDLLAGGVTLQAARTSCRILLRAAELQPIVLIDNMEDLHHEVHTLSRVLAGLFTLIGRTDRAPQQELQFRFCYPSELWGKLSEFAANPLKDAENHIKLFWHARELIKIAGHRLSLFISLYHAAELSELYGKRGYDPTSYEDARALLERILPPGVVNAFGSQETTIAYAMRHTQLLPRHLLRILNGVMRRSRELGDDPLAVSPQAVTDGVNRVEELLVTEIFTAYSAVHPFAREVCRRVIPDLDQSFSDGQLHKVFNQTGIRKATGLEYFDFKEMLFEVGCVGRVLGRTDRYVEGEFDYTLPTPLFPGADDELCLHPLFSRVFRSRIGEAGVPVYPYGADPQHQPTW